MCVDEFDLRSSEDGSDELVVSCVDEEFNSRWMYGVGGLEVGCSSASQVKEQ